MSRLFITGDTHIPYDIRKLSKKKWSDSRELTKDDFLIITGDFGLIWDIIETREEKYWKKWLDDRNFTTLFVDGNHENHPRLERMEKSAFLGGTVGIISDSIFHLRRGEIYNINNKKILTIGGSHSHDIEHRIKGVSWWEEEELSANEEQRTMENLEKHQYGVDIIVTHTLPESITRYLSFRDDFYPDPCKVRIFLDKIVANTQFSNFYCGHFHVDQDYKQYHVLYNRIIEIS